MCCCWDRSNYNKEAAKQLNDTNVYQDICFNDKFLQDLVGASNQLFQNLEAKRKISDKQLNISLINIKNLLVFVNSIFYLRYINVRQMFLEGL